MVITRSCVTSASDDNTHDKEVFETPLKESGKTPSTSKPKKQILHPRSYNLSNARSESLIATPGYICSICKNSELLRSSTLDTNMESLMGKLSNANEQFSNSMSKI